MIKNIVLDFGGVILTDDDAGFLFENKELLDKYSVNKSILESAWDKHWRDVGEARLTIVDFYNELQKDIIGRTDLDFSKRMFEIYKEKTKTLPLYGILPKLSERYNLYALTNIFKEGLIFKREKFKLDKYFRLIVASCEVGLSKPSAQIFEYLINETKIKTNESLFIDDREKNTVAAEHFGFSVIKHQEFSSTIKQLKDLNIL